MKLHLQSDNGVTLIENRFIDQYMPSANGEYVKLYLYLLRCASSGKELSVSSIADFLDHTEKDVQRALKYWEKLRLLRLEYDADGGISDISFLEHDTVSVERGPVSSGPEPVFSAPEPDEVSENPVENQLPDRSFLTDERRLELSRQQQMKQLVFVAQQYLGRPITSGESDDLMYYAEGLHFSEDLIEYLIEYCAERGNTNRRYMERVAQEWYLEGVTSVAEAKNKSGRLSKDYYSILKAFDITGRSPAPSERKYIDRWINEYAFPLETIALACDKAILGVGKPSFAYAEGILKNWAAQGLRTPDQVSAQEDGAAPVQENTAVSVKGRRQQVSRGASAASGYRGSGKAGSKNSFNNFPQREYDWSVLEKQLVNIPSAKS